MASFMTGVQRLGRTLMLPIAVLPVAGLLLRFGQADFLDIPFVAAAGGAIFANLGLLFAIGVAVGFARENHGAAGLAGVVCYLVASKGAETLLHVPADIVAGFADNAVGLAETIYRQGEIGKLGVPIGILSGVISGLLYNKYSNIKLPEFLAFFGGRRFVPIAAGVAGLVLAGVFGFFWIYIESGVAALSRVVVDSGEIGLFVYGLLNRVLIVTGLHHILNNVAWFIIGEYQGASGDLNRFFAGDKTAGAFMAGFFPVMMFGLPAACLAMYHAALPERRKEVGGMLASMGLTSFLTGVTEPIEFTFMFLAPALYAIHAVLTGVAMMTMDILGVKLGFGFSAGAIDYFLNFNKSTRPLLLIPVGLFYGAVYYGLFRAAIAAFKLKTPGREPNIDTSAAARSPQISDREKAAAFLTALGGAENITSIEACTTRLRLVLVDSARIDEPGLKDLGARGFIRPSAQMLQVVLGPSADRICGEIKDHLAREGVAPLSALQPEAAPEAAATPPINGQSLSEGQVLSVLSALGGAQNIAEIRALASRLLVTVKNFAQVNGALLRTAGLRGVFVSADRRVHLITGPGAEEILNVVKQRLAKA